MHPGAAFSIYSHHMEKVMNVPCAPSFDSAKLPVASVPTRASCARLVPDTTVGVPLLPGLAAGLVAGV